MRLGLGDEVWEQGEWVGKEERRRATNDFGKWLPCLYISFCAAL